MVLPVLDGGAVAVPDMVSVCIREMWSGEESVEVHNDGVIPGDDKAHTMDGRRLML